MPKHYGLKVDTGVLLKDATPFALFRRGVRTRLKNLQWRVKVLLRFKKR